MRRELIRGVGRHSRKGPQVSERDIGAAAADRGGAREAVRAEPGSGRRRRVAGAPPGTDGHTPFQGSRRCVAAIPSSASRALAGGPDRSRCSATSRLRGGRAARVCGPGRRRCLGPLPGRCRRGRRTGSLRPVRGRGYRVRGRSSSTPSTHRPHHPPLVPRPPHRPRRSTRSPRSATATSSRLPAAPMPAGHQEQQGAHPHRCRGRRRDHRAGGGRGRSARA